MVRETFPGRQNFNPAATGAGRIDGVAKVTGSKLYAADFRAADLPGWPAKTSHAMLIRTTDATHIFDGLDLSRLTGALKPSVVVTAEDLARIGTRVPEFYAGDLFCPMRKTPLYLGQAVALLIFEDFDTFDQARLALRDAPVVKYGEETGPLTRPPYAAFRFTRVAGATPDAPDVYSPVKNGWVSPGVLNENQHPVWERLPIATGLDYAEAAGHGEAIRAELAADNPARLVLERQFETQSADPMFLEPESGLAWYDAGRKTLELVVGVQSPTMLRNLSASCSAKPTPRTSRRASTRILLTWAAVSADATIRRFQCTWRSRRCSAPAGRCGSPTIASSNSNRGSSGTASHCARAWVSIGLAAKSSLLPPTTCCTPAG